MRVEEGASLELRNVVLRNCSAPSGGEGGEGSGRGGAVFVGRNSVLSVAESEILDGYARHAGGGCTCTRGVAWTCWMQ